MFQFPTLATTLYVPGGAPIVSISTVHSPIGGFAIQLPNLPRVVSQNSIIDGCVIVAVADA